MTMNGAREKLLKWGTRFWISWSWDSTDPGMHLKSSLPLSEKSKTIAFLTSKFVSYLGRPILIYFSIPLYQLIHIL